MKDSDGKYSMIKLTKAGVAEIRNKNEVNSKMSAVVHDKFINIVGAKHKQLIYSYDYVS